MAPAEPTHETADPAGTVTARPLLLVGGGEHAGVVAEAAATDRTGWRIVGYTDPRPDLGSRAPDGVVYLGDDAEGLARVIADDATAPSLVLAVGGIADSGTRRRVADAIDDIMPTASWAVIVHDTAWVSPSADLAPGAVILAGAIVNAGARVGSHGIVNSRAVVEHDVRLGDFVHVGPGAVIGGGARIGSNVTVGMGALVRDHIVVGDGVTIGMGAVVVADVPPGATVLGSPARPRAAPATAGTRS